MTVRHLSPRPLLLRRTDHQRHQASPVSVEEEVGPDRRFSLRVCEGTCANLHLCSNTSGSDGSGSSSGGTNIGAIVGGVVGGIAALAILALVLFLMRRRRRRQNAPMLSGAPNKGSGGMFDRSRRNTQADMDLLGAGEDAHGRPSQEYLHNANDDSPGSYEPQPYLGGFPYPQPAQTSSGVPGTRTSYESQPNSETMASRSSRPQSFGLAEFGQSDPAAYGMAATGTPAGHPGMTSIGSVTTASPQLPTSPLPIASMYSSPNNPSNPMLGSSEGPARSNSTRKRRPANGVGPDGRPATRFVLHQDAGEIEDAGPEDVAEGDVV